MSRNFVLYRLPYADHYHSLKQTVGEPMCLHSYADIGSADGFVFAPFKISAESPILLLKPDVEELVSFTGASQMVSDSIFINTPEAAERQSYHRVFSKFHSCLNNGDFDKIVLSRRHIMKVVATEEPTELFMRACCLYPRMFVALISMQKAGTWLMATPEILLEGSGNNWNTIALAGTMRLSDEQLSFDTPNSTVSQDSIKWSEKNLREQHYVSSYIYEKLKIFSTDIIDTEPYTVRAGRLVHLRSDFHFTLPPSVTIGNVIAALHPTPAVCGMPPVQTYNFIISNEGFDRHYYSGFSGIVDREAGTHLYVALRCMQMFPHEYHLYAGGGILRDSVEQQEWCETEAKMETMRRCLKL